MSWSYLPTIAGRSNRVPSSRSSPAPREETVCNARAKGKDGCGDRRGERDRQGPGGKVLRGRNERRYGGCRGSRACEGGRRVGTGRAQFYRRGRDVSQPQAVDELA